MMPLPTPQRRPTTVEPDDSGFESFAGLVTTRTAKELGHKALTVATNIEIDNDGRALRRDGFALLTPTGGFRSAYATVDQERLLALQDTNVVRVLDDGSSVALKSGLSLTQLPNGVSWSEDPQGNVAYATGIDCGIVRNTGLDWVPLFIDRPNITAAALLSSAARQSLPFHLGEQYTSNTVRIFATYLTDDGRESAPSAVWSVKAPPEAALLSVSVPRLYRATNVYACMPGGSLYLLAATSAQANFTITVDRLVSQGGVDYPYTTAIEPFPSGARVICYHGSMLFAGEFVPTQNASVIWRSLPLQHHLYNKAEDFFTVIGEVLLLLSTAKGLIVATDSQIYGWDGTSLTQLAPYGVVPGSCGDVAPDDTAYFWTLRGIAKAFPYELVTEKTFAGDPGVFNHARLFYDHGYCKLLASTVTGNPVFNERTER
jgi:hypothetical protein